MPPSSRPLGIKPRGSSKPPRLPARPAAAARGEGASEHVQEPVKRGAFQRAVHLNDQGKRLPATFTHWPWRCYRRQGVLRAGEELRLRLCSGTSPTPSPRSPHQHPPTPAPALHLTGRPPSLLAVQAPGPVGRPCTAVSRSPSSTSFRKAAMTTRHPRGKANYGSRDSGPLRARAPATPARRPRPLMILRRIRCPELRRLLPVLWAQNPGAPDIMCVRMR